jgi:ABC-2 type transport system permease protein
VWQDYNPEKKMGNVLLPEFVFVDSDLATQGTEHPFNPDDPISSGLRQVLFLWPGSVRRDNSTTSKLDFQPLAVTGTRTGTETYRDLEMGMRSGRMMDINRMTTKEPYILAAHIKGNVTADPDLYLKDKKDAKDKAAKKDDKAVADAKGKDSKDAKDAKDAKNGKEKEEDALAGKEPEKTKLDVVLVTDIDWILAPDIYRIREAGHDEDNPNDIEFKFQNIPFALNILDALTGDKDASFIDLRKRTRTHRTLAKIEEATEEQSKQALKEQSDFYAEAKNKIDTAKEEFRKKIADLQARNDLDPRAKAQLLEQTQMRLENGLNAQISSLEKDRNKKVKESERELAATVRGVQDRYKLLAVLLPPIPPILLAFFVFFHRRKAEQEGVDTRRLRFGRVPDEAAREKVGTH